MARRLAPLGMLVGAAGFAASLAAVYLEMRRVMIHSGGACASGGPYAIAAGHHCSSGQVGLLFGGIFGLLLFGGLLAGSAGARDGGLSGMDAGFLMWATLFGALGFNFLSLGFDPPAHMSGAGGWIAAGVVFELMALGGIVPLVWSAREWAQRGGKPEEPLFAGPAVRATVNEGLVYKGVPGLAYRVERADGEAVEPPAAPPPAAPAAPLPKRLVIPKRDWTKE